jgi:transposase-like protein
MISFQGRHHQEDMILQCVRWYLAYSLSYRDLEELMQECGYAVDHSTIQRWVVHYAPRNPARERPSSATLLSHSLNALADRSLGTSR